MSNWFQATVAAAALLCGVAGGAAAKDAALMIVNNDYRYLEDTDEVDAADDLKRPLEDEGFRVFDIRSEGAPDSWETVEDFREEAEGANRVLVFMAGRFVTTEHESWLLTRYADEMNDLSVGSVGVPLSAILRSVDGSPEHALVLLAPLGDEIELDESLRAGIADPDVPDGVGVLIGPTESLEEFVDKIALVPDAKMRSALRDQYPKIEPFGDVLDSAPFTMGEMSEAEQAEAALRLTRTQRRDVQRDLTILDHNPGGIDGIFGRVTRAAIADWQEDQGFDPTGYVNDVQVKVLGRQAAKRAAELEDAARKRAVEQAQQDHAYWDVTGKDGTAKGLLAYLKQYPDGLHADEANAALAKLQRSDGDKAGKAERERWKVAKDKDTVQAYEAYLKKHPKGYFADVAKARIDELKQAQVRETERKALAASEQALLKNGPLRLIVEQRLASLGLDPGAVDGKFNKKTRKALRQYQKSRGMAVTGYVDQITLARILVNF
ncbi:peptidoglycan-binding protein [Aliiroseovarius sp. S2029]|uniref:peptidoglycan-binding domain-containing protein n=1 Tax=Aliiroseovarius sp. S2029 TaxID=2936988 RepID=UPI0020C16C0D|nr:peptidoglycan-binding domain-containing protein [Aliiroseovarius sp. S2029]MCK8485454.1 peptidoglycan-binding protein [Aliiroseovarius sp. S2029]